MNRLKFAQAPGDFENKFTSVWKMSHRRILRNDDDFTGSGGYQKDM